MDTPISAPMNLDQAFNCCMEDLRLKAKKKKTKAARKREQDRLATLKKRYASKKLSRELIADMLRANGFSVQTPETWIKKTENTNP